MLQILPVQYPYQVNLINIDFNGYAIGGLVVGEPQQTMFEVIDNLIKMIYIFLLTSVNNLIFSIKYIFACSKFKLFITKYSKENSG